MTTHTQLETANDSNVILELKIDAAGNVHAKSDKPGGKKDTLNDKLIGHLYPGIRVVRVTVPQYLSAFEEAEVEKRMKNFVYEGDVYKLAGASGSSQDAKFYFVDESHHKRIAKRYQNWPEAMVTYFSILISDCKIIQEFPDLKVAVVKDHVLGTNDSRGWVRKSIYRQLELMPDWFTQFRLGYVLDDKRQFKGGLKPGPESVFDILGVDMVLPESCCKPELNDPVRFLPKLKTSGRLYSGPAVLGIKQRSKVSEFNASASVVSKASERAFDIEIKTRGIKFIQSIKRAFYDNDYEALLKLLGKTQVPSLDTSFNPEQLEQGEGAEVEAWDPVDAVLLADKSGSAIRFPYVLNHLDRKHGRNIYRALVSGGFTLPAFALVDDGILIEHEGKVFSASDWLPEDCAITSLTAQTSLCVRHPVRSERDLLPVRHLTDEELTPMFTNALGCGDLPDHLVTHIIKRQLRMEGAYVLNSVKAAENGGDFDFDTICAIPSDEFPIFVEDRFASERQYKKEETKNTTKNKKKKARALWWNLEHVAMSVRGSGRYSIGAITNLMTSCAAAGLVEEEKLLGGQLQNALDALKWGVEVEAEVVDPIREKVEDAAWLQYKRISRASELPEPFTVPGTDKVGRLYNYLRMELGDTFKDKRSIEDFRGLFEGHTYTKAMFEECQLANSIYGDVVHQITGGEEPLRAAFDAAHAHAQQMRKSPDKKLKNAAWETRNKALAELREYEESAKERFRGLHLWLNYWAQGKVENRRGWAQAMNTVVSNGDGTGAILFHSFPQEIVDAFAEQTGGDSLPVRAAEPITGHVRIDDEQRAFLVEHIDNPDGTTGEKHLFLWQYTGQRELILEDTRVPHSAAHA